tara:strand:- start:610 stop:1644 length:1035 start_codon:yes stop_codon:yes gene_type:complete
MRIAIIGAGFFGLTVGLFLSKKHKVEIFEKKSSIMQGASFGNQLRFHHGYHYPRSQKTVSEINKSKDLFYNYYGQDIFGKTSNYYLIANKSKVNFIRYKSFLNRNKLTFRILKNSFNKRFIENHIVSNEKILDYFKFKEKIIKKIRNSNLKINLNTEFEKSLTKKFDKILVATYANNNFVLKKLGIKKLEEFKYELVEKILIKLPKKFKKKSYVVVDGKFVCVDPYLGTNYHLLSDVKLSKLETTTGRFPLFKHRNKKFLNKGIIKDLKISEFNNFIRRSSNYLPFLKDAKYIGSIFVVRTIMKNKERTDERTSVVKIHTKKILSILSGKWNNCVFLAQNFKIK